MIAGLLFATGFSQWAAQEKEGVIPEITIAAKSPQQLHKTGKNVLLISSKDLEKYKGQNAAEILNQVSGFQITGTFNNASEPKSMKIRGGHMANVLILVDGIPLKDATGNDYNATDLRLFSAENIESIEILNGASSVLYGSNATVSVINIKTKKSAIKPFEGNIGARIGSFGKFAQNATFKGKKDNFNYQISGFNEKSEGISSAEGKDFDKDGFSKQNVNARIGYQKENFSVNVNGGYQHHFYDFDNGAFEDGKYRGNDTQLFGGVTSQYNYGKGNLNFNSRISGNDRLVSNYVNNKYQDQYEYQGQNIFLELFNQTKFSEKINLVTGVQYETQNLSAKTLPWGGNSMQSVLKMGDTSINNFDVFANTNLQHNIFHLDLGGRLNVHSKYNSHFVYSINPFILKDFENLYVKVGYSFATAFIAPTLYQNYGSLPYVLPNFDLKPETNSSHEIDLSIGKKDRSFIVNLSLYERQEKDVFFYQVTDYVNYTGKYFNINQNKVKGVEFGLQYKLNEILNIGGNFSFAEKDNPTTRLRSPKQRANAFVEILPFKNNRINVSYEFVSKRDDAYYDNTTFSTKNIALDPINLFNININQKINKNFEAYLNIGNVFNTKYIDVVGFTTKPRNYGLGIEYKF